MRSSLVLAALGALVLSGCARMAITGSADIDRTAFGAKKRYAVVSISSMKTFHGEKGLTQLFTDTDDIPGANSQPLIDALHPRIIAALQSNKNFTLLPEQKVLASKAYKGMAEDARVFKVMFTSDDINVAGKYKYFSDPAKLAQLAKTLGVDGVITVSMGFSVVSSKGGVSVNGLSFGSKSYSSMATITALAYDRKGKVVWKDSTVKEAEPGDKKAVVVLDTSDITKTDFRKMHPSAIEIGAKAVTVLMARFDDTMAGKEVSSMQRIKD
ncbi:MAG: hypothetical protein AB1450_01775 [Pseudomonadota bacterium]